MIKANVLIFGSLILATILGLYGQDISYFLNENTTAKISPIYYLTSLTMISVSLYLFTIALTYIFVKKKKIKKDNFRIYLAIIGCVGFLTSIWSLFVLAMWWG